MNIDSEIRRLLGERTRPPGYQYQLLSACLHACNNGLHYGPLSLLVSAIVHWPEVKAAEACKTCKTCESIHDNTRTLIARIEKKHRKRQPAPLLRVTNVSIDPPADWWLCVVRPHYEHYEALRKVAAAVRRRGDSRRNLDGVIFELYLIRFLLDQGHSSPIERHILTERARVLTANTRVRSMARDQPALQCKGDLPECLQSTLEETFWQLKREAASAVEALGRASRPLREAPPGLVTHGAKKVFDGAASQLLVDRGYKPPCEGTQDSALQAGARGDALHALGSYYESYKSHYESACAFGRIGSQEEQMNQLLFCLSNLRPLGRNSLIRQVAFEIAGLFRSNRSLPRFYWGLFLENIGIVCFDYGELTDAQMLFGLAHVEYDIHLDLYVGGLGESIVREQNKWNLRREGHTQGVYDIKKGLALLTDTVQAFEYSANLQGVSHGLFSQLCLYVQHGKHSEALDFLEEKRVAILQGTVWTRDGLDLLEAHVRYGLGDVDKAREIAERVLPHVVSLGLCVPRLQMRDGTSPFRADRILGPEHPLVRDFGEIRERGACPFSQDDLRDLIGVRE